MYQRSSMRYAHAKGYTSLDYTQSGANIITCGADGDIRNWNGIDDDDPSSHCLGEFVICVAHNGAQLLASTDLNTVQAYTYPDMERDGTPMRFTAPVTCMRVNSKYIVAGSEDTTLKVLRQGETAPVQLQGHEGPLLSLDISCNDQLATACGDGTLKIWNLNDMQLLKTITGLPLVKTFEAATCYATPTFEPLQGKCLAYAQGKRIIVLNTDSWAVQCTLSDEQLTAQFSCCQFSRNGQFLAGATSAGELCVFDFARRQSLKCETTSSECYGITALAWHPHNAQELAYCDNTGQLGTLFAAEGASAETDQDQLELLYENGDAEQDELQNGHFDDMAMEDEDNDDAISLDKLKSDTMRAYDAAPASSRSSVSAAGDDGARSPSPTPTLRINKQQRAFQPSSTPSELEHRYLVWNNVGIVKAHQDGAGDGSIDVEFHDASVHHSLHIPNFNNNHNMASLSATVLALSGEGATKLTCIALNAAGNKEWSIELPDCEGAQALVATTKLVGVATDMRFLRLFSVMGTQRAVISLPGPVLAMAGHTDRLCVCYHSAGAGEEQQLSALLLQTVGMSLRAREIRVPLPPGRKMTWLGYTDSGSPVFCDSMGLVQLYSMTAQLWQPICDTMKQSQSVSNNYFVIDVSERTQIIQVVLCRGCSYPMTTPRPIVTELQLQLPLCELDSEKSQLEDALIRSCNLAMNDAERVIKETAIKLFANACRGELELRAKELIELIASPKLLPLAVKYATKLGRIHLSERLQQLMPQLEAAQEERAQEARNMHNDALSIIEQSPLNAGLLLLQSQSKSALNTPNSAKLAPKAMVLSNQKRNPFKRLSVQSNNVPEKKPEFELSSTLSLLSTPADADSMLDISTPPPLLEQENHSKPEKGFMPWFAKNKTQLQAKHPAATDAELAKIGMREFKDIARPAAAGGHQTNPFAAKRKIAEVDGATESTPPQGLGSIAGKLAKFEYKN